MDQRADAERACRAVGLVLAAALACGALTSAAAAADCAAAPSKALSGLVRRAMQGDKINVYSGAPADFLGWTAPGKSLTFMNGSVGTRQLNPGETDESHLFIVVVRPGKTDRDLIPVSLLLIHMIRTAQASSREMFDASLSGRLNSAGVFSDDSDLETDDKDPQAPRGGTKLQRLGPFTPRAASLYASELKALCRAAKRPALQEQARGSTAPSGAR